MSTSTPIIDTKRAVEKHLKSLDVNTPIGWEGVNFNPPVNQLYLRTQFVINSPTDPTISDKYYRERISFQVFVCDMKNKGTIGALTKAEQIRNHFNKGLTLVEDGTYIHVLTTPQITGTSSVSDRLIVPVIIELITEVYKQ
jgi:hypothetical protein